MIIWVGLPVVAMLLGVFVALTMTRESSDSDVPVSPVRQPLIVVLPVIDLDGENNRAFNEGLVDEISAGLAMVPGLEIRGRSSARTFTDVNRDAVQVGAQLGASIVLDATSRRTGQALRVAARLIDTRSGAVVWSGVHETNLDAWFSARDAVVEGVASALGLSLNEESRVRLARRRTNIKALDLYALGRFGWAEGDDGDLLEAISYYGLSIEADSGFAPAWTALAEAYSALPRFSRFPVETVRRDGAAAARTALQIDPSSANAHAVLGELLYLYERDHPGGRAHLERALELDPGNGNVLTSLCELSMYEGRLADAEDSCRRAVEVDLLSFQGSWLLANLKRLQGDLDGALAGLESLRIMFPDYLPLSTDVLLTQLLVGNPIRSQAELQNWIGLLGGGSELATELSGSSPAAGLRRLSLDIDPSPSDLTALSILLGEHGLALEAATRAVSERDPGTLRFAVFPEYAVLKESAEFQALLGALNLGVLDGQ